MDKALRGLCWKGLLGSWQRDCWDGRKGQGAWEGAMGRVLGRGREWEEDDPAKRLSLWAGHGSVGAMGAGGVAMAKMIVAVGAVALGSLTHRGSAEVERQLVDRTHTCAITHDTGHRDSPTRNVVTPEAQDQGEGGNLEGDQKGLIDEEVPASHGAKSVIDKMAS